MDAQPSVDILMATYNGEAFVGAQIDSLLAQTDRDWRLTIRDDGSRDRTVEICERYALEHPSRIRLVRDNKGNQGFVGNFGLLLRESTAPYVMFCDQDDIWDRDKVEVKKRALLEVEAECGVEVPALVYTDARVVGMNLEPISGSLLDLIRRDRLTELDQARICMSAPCYGCASVFNRALARMVDGFPRETLSHDWYVGMVACFFGRLRYLDRTTLLHRRHSGNRSNARKSSLRTYLRERKSVAFHREAMYRILEQALAFGRAQAGRLSPGQAALFSDIELLMQSGWLQRRRIVLKHGLFKSGMVKNLGVLLTI